MNRKQRACVVAGFLLVIAATLIPPWRSGRYESSYGFLFNAPYGGATIEFSRLFVEWALVFLVTLGLVYFVKETPSILEKRVESTESIWRRLFSLSMVLYLLLAALGITSYVLYRKVRLLENGIQNVKGLLDADLNSVSNFQPTCYALPDFIPAEKPVGPISPEGVPIQNGSTPVRPVGKLSNLVPIQNGAIPVSPVGKLTPICSTPEQTRYAHMELQTEYRRVVGTMQKLKEPLDQVN